MFEEIFLLKMGDYPNEIVDMIRIVGEVGNNFAAARLYLVRFPDRRHLNRKVMKRLSDRAEHRGTQTHTNENGSEWSYGYY